MRFLGETAAGGCVEKEKEEKRETCVDGYCACKDVLWPFAVSSFLFF
jgi:hypothetical protein